MTKKTNTKVRMMANNKMAAKEMLRRNLRAKRKMDPKKIL
jgi:hypothetical protein